MLVKHQSAIGVLLLVTASNHFRGNNAHPAQKQVSLFVISIRQSTSSWLSIFVSLSPQQTLRSWNFRIQSQLKAPKFKSSVASFSQRQWLLKWAVFWPGTLLLAPQSPSPSRGLNQRAYFLFLQKPNSSTETIHNIGVRSANYQKYLYCYYYYFFIGV